MPRDGQSIFIALLSTGPSALRWLAYLYSILILWIQWIKASKPLWSKASLQKYLRRLILNLCLGRKQWTFSIFKVWYSSHGPLGCSRIVEWCARRTGYVYGSKYETHDFSNRSIKSFLELAKSLKPMTPQAMLELELIFLESEQTRGLFSLTG